MACSSQLDAGSSYWLILAGLLPLGAGMGVAMTPATSAITSALPSAQQGVASAMNDLSRELGGALGIAVIGSVLTATYRANLSLPGYPGELVDKAKESFAVAAHAGGPAAAGASNAFMDGLHVALLVGSVSAVVAAAAVALLLPRHEGAEPADAEAELINN